MWRVQHNDGGTLAFPDNPVQVKRVYSPRPLPPSGNELTLNRYAKPTLQTLVDIDGDGVLDVVALPGDPIGLLVDPSRNGVDPFKPLGQATTLEVWRGSVSDGDFNVSATKQSWPLPHFDVMLSGTEQNSTPPDRVQHFVTKLQAVLSDVNGDGLPDLVVEQHDGLYVGWNQQSWFGALAALGATGPIAQTQSDLTSWTASNQLSSGRSGTWKRLVDIDADGLPDLVTLARTAENVGSSLGVRTGARNLGQSVALGAAPAPMWDAAKGLVLASQGNWYRAGDLVNLTGDGLPESSDLGRERRRDGAHRRPGQLMRSQHPVHADSAEGADGADVRCVRTARGRHQHHRALHRAAGRRPTLEVARDHRQRPRWHRAPSLRPVDRHASGRAGGARPAEPALGGRLCDRRARLRPARDANQLSLLRSSDGHVVTLDPSPPHFLGFARVEIIRPRQDGTGVGSRVVREFDYSIGQDHSGRLVHEQTFLGGVATPITNRQLTWRNVGVLGAVSFSYREQELARTCKPGEALASCKLLRTTDTWTPYTLAGGAGLYLHERTTQGPGATAAPGDRSTRFWYEVRVGQADYRVLETKRERQHGTDFSITSARTETLYNTAGLPYRTEVSLTASVTAVTARTFDAQTGNLLTTKRPNQVALNTFRVTSQQYDSHRLYVNRTVNELGHEVLTTTDTGTGVVVRRRVPTAARCRARRRAPRRGCWPPRPGASTASVARSSTGSPPTWRSAMATHCRW